MTRSPDHFPASTIKLPPVKAADRLDIADGEQVVLRIAPVIKTIGDATVRMLAYNGSVPGPTLRVPQNSEIVVHVTNEGDMDATVHWHGLRLDNRFDGTVLVQNPIPISGKFTYRLQFPDPGVYWYHPHIREDYGQEMGLYGVIIVVPSDPDYWPPAHREVTLTLDDILIEDGSVAPFRRAEPTHTAMGRFGNILLVNGETDLSLTASRGEVVRFHVTNTANTRVFNVRLPGARMKLVGGDSGHYEREEFVERVLLAPSERATIDVLFEREGSLTLEHRTPDRRYKLATIAVGEEPAQPLLANQFAKLRTNGDMVAERDRMARYVSAEPDKVIALVGEMDMGEPQVPSGAGVEYVCPMHADIVRTEPGRCPKCGMKLIARQVQPVTYVCPMHPDVTSTESGRCPKCGMMLVASDVMSKVASKDHEHKHAHAEEHDRSHDPAPEHPHEAGGIEWEDDMIALNRITTPANMRWKLVDRATSLQGAAIDWRFRVGDRVKIRLVNEMESDHPMHHPFHVHGAGRFLILSRNGVVEPNLVWKDTVLLRAGETVDILLDVTNPGTWMAHCHISEHHESGMMFNFTVQP
jgi:FtsP/CotA-like multicopper oxidase with cupredoxin domain